ncbi:MAG: ABC transporter permease, partial [Christensenellaceae bacterium]
MNTTTAYESIDKSKFRFAQREVSHDTKLASKPVGYLKDAMRRFSKNKASVAASYIILLLLLFAIFVPLFCTNTYTEAVHDTDRQRYAKLLPKSNVLSFLGWDGCSNTVVNEGMYLYYRAIGAETGLDPVHELYEGPYKNPASGTDANYYSISLDSYYGLGMTYLTLTQDQYDAMQAWQDERQIQLIYPAVDTKLLANLPATMKNDANIWYKTTNKGVPVLDANGEYQAIYKTSGTDGYTSSMRIPGDDGSYRYALRTGTSAAASYSVRVSLYNYFIYKYDFEPCFFFGTGADGLDILTRLASGAQFSFLLAICVSSINLFIGAIYGAVEGYFGGTTDLVMERVSDILGGVPFMVVTTLFQLHLASKVGPVVALLFAFVTTGWLGTAGTVRMQFYRYKSQEYVMAARTLGAKNGRLMFKHIFPNALGTIITSSVLVIPSCIFSESSLTYLGIINLEGSGMTS